MGSDGGRVAGVLGNLAGPERPRWWVPRDKDRWISGDLQYHPEGRTGASDEYWISHEVGSGGQAAVFVVGGIRPSTIDGDTWVMRAWLTGTDAESRGQPSNSRQAHDVGKFAEVRRRQLRVNGLSTLRSDFPSLPLVRESFLASVVGGRTGTPLYVDIVERAHAALSERLGPSQSASRSAATLMTAEEVALTFAPMCRTLSNLHIRRIVHRDIDERNVLAATDGSLRLNDWGSVAVAGDDTRVIARARALNVPPEYRDQMRVERVNGQDVVRLKKWTTWQLEPTYDAWQVGRLMYVMLTGDVMLGTKELIQKPNLSFDDIFGQSREVAEVVRGLTEPEPGDRMKLRKAEEMLVSSFSQPSPAWPSIDRVRCSAGDEASDESFVGVAGRAAGGRVRGDTVPVPVVGAVAELAAVGVTVEELGDWWQVSTSPETTYRVRGVEKTVGTYRTGTVIEVGSQRYVLGH